MPGILHVYTARLWQAGGQVGNVFFNIKDVVPQTGDDQCGQFKLFIGKIPVREPAGFVEQLIMTAGTVQRGIRF